MIRMRTGSRLHFGLFSVPSEQSGPWLNQEGKPTMPRRLFGGAGLMIDEPGIELTVEKAERWSAAGDLAERALQLAQTYCGVEAIKDSFAIRIEQAAPEHSGLGTGTQLGLAVARAIAELTHQSARDPVTLATVVGRGRRSALGVHGFEHGGFLVEGGKSSESTIAPLLIRRDFPDEWRILLVRPREVVGIHGRREATAFADLVKQPPDDRTTEGLCRLLVLGLLPALAERDLPTFGEALYDFNRRSGAIFKTAQGGTYAHPRVEQIVKAIRGLGIAGVGQSSWGPTVFAVCSGEEADAVRRRLVEFGIEAKEMRVASAYKHGAEVTTGR